MNRKGYFIKIMAVVLATVLTVIPVTTSVKADTATIVTMKYDDKTYVKQLYGPDVEQIKAGVTTAGLQAIGEQVDNLNFVSNGSINVNKQAVMTAVKNSLVAGQTSVLIDLKQYTQAAINAAALSNLQAPSDSGTKGQSADAAALATSAMILSNQALVDMGIDCKISEGSTKFSPNQDRAVNVRNAASKINGMILQPGQLFSADLYFMPRTKANGYGLGDVINGDTHVKGMGGGICQVSSTLNLAVLGAGIVPMERHNHSERSKYIGSGLDATISSGSYDYKFINTLAYPIYISAVTNGGVITISFYSNHDALKGILYQPEVVGAKGNNKTFISGYLNGVKVSSVYAYSSKYK